jgi:hypothetical protein
MHVQSKLFWLREEVINEEKLIKDFDLMQADVVPIEGPGEPSAEAMWTLLEQCACYAEDRRRNAIEEINHLEWLKNFDYKE